MNTKTKRLLDALAVIMMKESDDLIRKVHTVISDKQDGYDYDFIDTVNTFRVITGNWNLGAIQHDK